jgi:hypothetical protein
MIFNTSSRLTIVASLVAAFSSACSFVFVEGPPAPHQQLARLDCTSERTWPVVDAVLSGMYVATAGVFAFSKQTKTTQGGMERPLTTRERITEEAAIAGAALLFGSSSYVGFGRVGRCREAKGELEARQEAARRDPNFGSPFAALPALAGSPLAATRPGPGALSSAGAPSVEAPSRTATEASPGVLEEYGQAVAGSAPSPLATPGAPAEVTFRLNRAPADSPPDKFTLALLRDTGMGALGKPGGDAVRVSFPDGHCGPGWVDEAGRLQAVVRVEAAPPAAPSLALGHGAFIPQTIDRCLFPNYAPAAGDRAFEWRNGRWVELEPGIRVSSREATEASGRRVKVTMASLDGTPDRSDTLALMAVLGISVRRPAEQRVRLRLDGGRIGAGVLSPRGRLALESSEGWKPWEHAVAAAAAPSGGQTLGKLAPGELEVDARVMAAVAKLGTDIAFFTSSAHPIKSLRDIKTTGTEVGVGSIALLGGVGDALEAAGVKLGARGKGLMRMIGDAYFPTLFRENQALRLFVTSSDGAAEIASAKAGGLRVSFRVAGGAAEPVAAGAALEPAPASEATARVPDGGARSLLERPVVLTSKTERVTFLKITRGTTWTSLPKEKRLVIPSGYELLVVRYNAVPVPGVQMPTPLRETLTDASGRALRRTADFLAMVARDGTGWTESAFLVPVGARLGRLQINAAGLDLAPLAPPSDAAGDTTAPRPVGAATAPAGWPAAEPLGGGSNEVRVRNPNPFSVRVGVRRGGEGVDFSVPAQGVSSAYVPDGSYDVYFNYSNQPGAVFQGDSFSLAANGIEIQIVESTAGNYGIRRVR